MKTSTERAFTFWTSANLVIVAGERAQTLGALRELVAECPGACVFHHTYQVLRDRHYIRDQYPNEFAQWVQSSVREEWLAERLAGIDLRSFPSVAELREEILRVLDEHIAAAPRDAGREANEPFYLCRAQTITMPTGRIAHDPLEFIAELRRCGIRSVYNHFVEARLRFHLNTNDFSEHLRTWGLDRVAERVNDLDLYANTLYQLRERIAVLVEREVAA